MPTGTTLTSLIALSGGKQAQNDSSEVIIKRKGQKIHFDLEDYLESEESEDPVLKSGDIIALKEHDPLVDRDALNTVALLSSIASIVLAITVVSNNSN